MSAYEALPAFGFAEPLREGVVVRRKSQFTMAVNLGGEGPAQEWLMASCTNSTSGCTVRSLSSTCAGA